MNATPRDQHRLFDWLCMLRALYARRGPRDRVGIISTQDVIRYGETLLSRSAASTA